MICQAPRGDDMRELWSQPAVHHRALENPLSIGVQGCASMRVGFATRDSRHEVLQSLRFVTQPFRIVGSAVEDGRGLERLEFAARGGRGGL